MNRIVLYSILSLFLLSSCFEGKIGLPSVTGQAGEVILVSETSVVRSDAGKAVLEVLRAPYPGFLNDEPLFDVQHLTKESFKKPMFRPARNIVEVDVSDRYSAAKIIFRKDVWAHPQAYARVQGPDMASVVKLVKEEGQKLVWFFQEADRQRFVDYYDKHSNFDFRANLKQKFGIDMVIPAFMKAKKDVDGFLWFTNNDLKARQDICFYSFPYTGPDMVSLEHITHLCDSVSKRYVAGHLEGSYKVSSKLVPISYHHVSFRDKFCAEMRGSWIMEGDMMGGPFLRWARVDEERQQLVVAEVFIYAPGMALRNLMMMLESELYTWKFDYEEGEVEQEVSPVEEGE